MNAFKGSKIMFMGHYRSEFLRKLHQEGYNYKNVDDIFNQDKLDSTVVELILKYLPVLYIENIATADTLVRALMSAKDPFDPSLLIHLFEDTDLNLYLKSGIGLALAYAKTTDISEWMRSQLLHGPVSTQKHALIAGLYSKGGFTSVKGFMSFLKLIFDNYHNEIVLKLFKKYGDSDDFYFLEEKAKTADASLAKEITKVLKKKKPK